MYNWKRDKVTYSKIKNLCITLENLGFAPYGLNIAKYRYFNHDLKWKRCRSLMFHFRFWEEEDY